MDHKPSELVQRYALSASKVSPVSLTTIEWPLIHSSDVILVSNRFTCLTPLYLPWNISFCQMWASSLVSSQAYPEVSLFYAQIPMKSRRGDLTNMKVYI